MSLFHSITNNLECVAWIVVDVRTTKLLLNPSVVCFTLPPGPHQPRPTHRSRGRRVEVKQAANVWSGRVNGRVEAELLFVHAQAGAALLHHLTQDIHLHLRKHTEPTAGLQQCDKGTKDYAIILCMLND